MTKEQIGLSCEGKEKSFAIFCLYAPHLMNILSHLKS